MKRINVRLLSILVALFMVGLVGTFGLYRYQISRPADNLLRLVQEKEESGADDEAIRYLGRYVLRRKDDKEQAKRLALMMKKRVETLVEEQTMDRKFFGQAFQVLEKTIRGNPTDVELREAAIDLAMRYFQRYPDAIEHLETLIKQEGDKSKSDWRIQLALAYHRSGQIDKALPLLNGMIGWDPQERTFDIKKATAPDVVDAYALLSGLVSSQMNDVDLAARVIDQMVIANPESSAAHLMRGQFLAQTRKGTPEEVRNESNKALELARDDADALVFAGEIALQEQDYVRSKALFERCRELHPDRIEPILGLQYWAANQNRLTEAIAFLNLGLKVNPKLHDLLWRRAALELELNELDDFEKTLTEYEKMSPPKMLVDMLKGLRCIRQQEWLKATRTLSEIRGQVEQLRPDLLAILDRQLSVAYERLGEQDLRLTAIERVLERNPGDLAQRWSKIECLLALRQEEKAIADYEILNQALESDKKRSSLLSLERLQIEMLKQQRLPKGLQDWKHADELAKRTLEQKSVAKDVKSRVVAEYYRIRGREADAEQLASTSEGRPADNLTTKLLEIKRHSYDQPLEATLKELDELEASTGPVPPYRLMRAEVLVRARPEDMKTRLKELEAIPETYSELEKLQLWAELGKYYVLANLPDDARRLWEEVLKVDRENVKLRLSLYELSLDFRDEAVVESELNKIAETFGKESAEWKWAQASRLVAAVRTKREQPEKLDEALGLVAEALALRDTWAQLYCLQADIHMLKQRADRALESYEKAIENGSANPIVYRNIIRLYYEQQRYADVGKVLKEFPESLWSDYERRIHLHLQALANQLPDDLPIDQFAKDAEGFTWIGHLLTDSQKYELAEEAFRKALKLNPKFPNAWTGLLLLKIRSNDPEGAMAIVEEGRDQIEPKSRLTFLAVSYRILGKTKEAEEQYLASLKGTPDNQALRQEVATFYLEANQIDKARKLIDQMLEGAKPYDPKATPQVRWARRARAQDIASSGNYEDFQKATQLIAENTPKGQPPVQDDLLLWCQLAANRPDKHSRVEAIRKLKDEKEAGRLTFNQLLVLAQLYNLEGNWPDCQTVITELLIERPKDLPLLDVWLRMLLQHDDLQGAAKWLENCPENSFTALRTKAHLGVRRGKSEVAVPILKQMVEAQGTSEQKVQNLRLAAQLAEELGAYDPKFSAAGDKVWQRVVQSAPASRIEYVDFLIRQNNLAQAEQILKLCGEIAAEGDHRSALQRAITMFRAFRDKLSDKDRVETTIRGWFDEGERKQPGEGLFVIQRSELEDLLGRPEEQERLLREFLEKFPAKNATRAVVLNNLSYITALKGNGDEAQKLVQAAMDILGPRATLLDTIGMAHLARGDAEAAVSHFQQAIDAGEVGPLNHIHLAMALWANDQKQQAVDTLKQAQGLGLSDSAFSSLERERFRKLVDEMRAAGFTIEENGAAPAIPVATKST